MMPYPDPAQQGARSLRERLPSDISVLYERDEIGDSIIYTARLEKLFNSKLVIDDESRVTGMVNTSISDWVNKIMDEYIAGYNKFNFKADPIPILPKYKVQINPYLDYNTIYVKRITYDDLFKSKIEQVIR
jgi:hypothetical protein